MLAQAFPPGELLADELKERGWSTSDLAERMPGDVTLNECAVELLIACQWRGVLIGRDLAERISVALGTSADYWLNLDAMWQAVAPEMPPA
jgi:HTH-type transcriptional regulator/antitoxin HigA